MAEGDRQLAFTTGPLPVSVQVSGADKLTPKTVNASFDGTGAAGAFLPCLIITGRTGHEVARIPAPQVAAGASAEVSWFPRVGGAVDGDGWKFDTDNEGGWGLVVANDTGPDGYSLQFDTGGSDAPIGFTNDGGFVVDTAGLVTINGGSGIVLEPGGNSLDLSGRKIINGADGIAPTDFATVGQIGGGGGVTDLDGITGSVTLVAGTNVTITDNDPAPGDIKISATGGGGGGGIIAYAKRTTGNPISTSATTFAGGANLLSASLSFIADGTSDYFVAVSAPIIANNTAVAEAQLSLVLDGADAGRFYFIITSGNVSGNEGVGLYGRGVVNAPSAGAHTINVRLWSGGGGTSLVQFGAGGASNDAPLAVTVETQ